MTGATLDVDGGDTIAGAIESHQLTGAVGGRASKHRAADTPIDLLRPPRYGSIERSHASRATPLADR